jgi:hypothetical protein
MGIDRQQALADAVRQSWAGAQPLTRLDRAGRADRRASRVASRSGPWG